MGMSRPNFDKVEVQLFSQEVEPWFFRNWLWPSAQKTLPAWFSYCVLLALCRHPHTVEQSVPWVPGEIMLCANEHVEFAKNWSSIFSQNSESLILNAVEKTKTRGLSWLCSTQWNRKSYAWQSHQVIRCASLLSTTTHSYYDSNMCYKFAAKHIVDYRSCTQDTRRTQSAARGSALQYVTFIWQ